jgi:NADH/NAD ratio-sensing transcriptional regulator Rex
MSRDIKVKGGKPKTPTTVDNSIDKRRAAYNVTKLRKKLSNALGDPQMREQILRAMRSLMYEDKT